MTDRFLIVAFGTSLLIHLGLLPILARLPQTQSKVPTTIPIELVDAPKIEKIRNNRDRSARTEARRQITEDRRAQIAFKTDNL